MESEQPKATADKLVGLYDFLPADKMTEHYDNHAKNYNELMQAI